MRALLALFVRSLKEDVRGKSTYIVRAALVLLVLFFLWITHSSARWSGAVGREFFASVMWVDLFVLSVVGLSYFASAITEEKENETLGLLRMTNLDALSILMGKSTGRLLGALFILAAQLPFMLVAVTMGGLAVHQVLAGFVCLLAYVFLLSNIGLFCSVVAKRGASATMFSAALIVVLLVLPWWLYASGQLVDGTWPEAWARATPFVQLKHVLFTGFADGIFGLQAVASLAAGAFFFGLAWLLFDRFADSSNERLGFAALTAPIRSGARRAKTLALRWKDYRYVAGGHTAVVIKALIVTVIFYVCSPMLKFDLSHGLVFFGLYATVLTGLFLALALALDAARIFKKERDQQTLSSLLMLPLSARRIIWEKTIGCLKTSWPAFAGVGIGLSVFACAVVHEIARRNFSSSSEFLIFTTGGFCYAVFTCLLLPVFVAWLSLRMRSGALPVGLTIWFLGNVGATSVLGLIAEEGSLIILPLISLCLVIGLWRSLPAKIEQLAAEE